MRHELTTRCGKFRIDREHVDACSAWLQDLMARVIIVRAEFHYEYNAIEYSAFCHEFEKIDPGWETPRYVAKVENGRFAGFSR